MNNPQFEIALLARLLEVSAQVRRFDTSDEPEAWALAHFLVDVSESMAKIQGSLIPSLVSQDDAQGIDDTLHDIGEELRHLLYHLISSRFYAYLREEDR